jgi:hypothetical protein
MTLWSRWFVGCVAVLVFAACTGDTTTDDAVDSAQPIVDNGTETIDTPVVSDMDPDSVQPADLSPPSTDAAVDVSDPPADPKADDDGDGLTNEEEAQIGTNPQAVDTDGDTYSDFDEVFEGKDPLDPNSRIYIGYWPYNPNKDAIVDPGWDSEPADGTVIPQYKAKDQYGDWVDLYDFAAGGIPIVLDVATWFCEPCKALAHYFATGDTTWLDTYPWWQAKYKPVKDLIDSGQLIWITVLYTKGNVPVGEEEVALWDETFPHEKIPVLADTDLTLQEFLKVVSMPHLDLLDPNMVFLIYEVKGPTSVMKELSTWAVDEIPSN